ncbi:hypothetical protein [Pseudobutyrivibrio sp.]|uniref:hypothetical protein n=1 Tax=Pseudobutyrivibrio sp. TaxID=2014367 RepID=UPI0025F13C09|nr:hypothetical protein [Pseudobutyrivibrio sp.]
MIRDIEKGIGLFVWNVLLLIEQGENEEIVVIEEKMRQKELVRYLYSKYNLRMSLEAYDVEMLEEFFNKRVEFIEGCELSKFGIAKTESGLFIIPVLFSLDVESPFRQD